MKRGWISFLVERDIAEKKEIRKFFGPSRIVVSPLGTIADYADLKDFIEVGVGWWW